MSQQYFAVLWGSAIKQIYSKELPCLNWVCVSAIEGLEWKFPHFKVGFALCAYEVCQINWNLNVYLNLEYLRSFDPDW
jgi:hypothetical protein